MTGRECVKHPGEVDGACGRCYLALVASIAADKFAARVAARRAAAARVEADGLAGVVSLRPVDDDDGDVS